MSSRMSMFTASAPLSTNVRNALAAPHHAWRSDARPCMLRTWPSWNRASSCGRTGLSVRASSVQEGEAAEAPPAAAGEWVEVGIVGAPHGVRGEFKVQPLTDFPEERLGTPGTRWLRAPVPKLGRRRAPPPTEVELEYGRTTITKGNEAWIVKLEGVESPEEAALLRGHSLLIPAGAREELEDEDEFYVQDLVGLRVFMQQGGEELGKVVDIFDGTGTHDVLRIQLLPREQEGDGGDASTGPKYILLPFAKELVPVVDLAARRMEVTPPEGLLELATAPAPKQQRKESRGRRQRRGGRRGRGGDGAGGDAAGSDEQSTGESSE